MRFLVLFRDPTGRVNEDAAMIQDVASEEELPPGVEAIRLSDSSDFPLTFGKQKGLLAAWEKVMARRSNGTTS